MANRFPILHSSLPIKGVILKNRLVLPPMATAKSDENGIPGDGLYDYYQEKTAGGHIGLVITEHSYVSPEGKARAGQLAMADESCVEGIQRLASVIHTNGSKVIAQINHAGSLRSAELAETGLASASPVRNPSPGNASDRIPRAMDLDEIGRIIAAFTRAAAYVKAAGFDGVEIHSAHGYLLNQFYSPLTNKRTDAYNGQTIEGRTRLHVAVVKAVREAVGPDFAIALRLGACDFMEGGSTAEDSVKAAVLLEQAGVDLLDISGGLSGYSIPGMTEQGYFNELTRPIKEAVAIPVMLTGGIVDASAAEHLLATGQCDLVGVGRAILKNASWAKEAMG